MNRIHFWQPMSPFWSDDWDEKFGSNWDLSFEDNELDMYETDNLVVVEVKCAGFKPEDLEVTLEDKVLSIKGEVKEEVEEKEEKKQYYRKEIKRKSFARSVTLPVTVRPEDIQTEFTNGMLKLTMQKVEEEKPKQIRINVK